MGKQIFESGMADNAKITVLGLISYNFDNHIL